MGTKKALTKQQTKAIERLGNKEVEAFEKNMFKLDSFGGINEAERLIKRYQSKNVQLSDEDVRILRENAPASPKFDIMSKKQYNSKGCWKRKKYRNKVEDYFKARKKYYSQASEKSSKELSKGQIFAMKKLELERRLANEFGEITDETTDLIEETKVEKVSEIKEKRNKTKKKNKKIGTELSREEKIEQLQAESDMCLNKYKDKDFFGDIPENSYDIEDVFNNRMNDKDYEAAEDEYAQKEMNAFKTKFPIATGVIGTYCHTGYGQMNKYLRGQGLKVMGCGKLIDAINKHPVKKDYVVRRGVKDLSTAGYMAGVDMKDMTDDKLKDVLKKKFEDSSEMIMTDNGFISTSMPHATTRFPAGDEFTPGIEFIILVKKGTHAVDVSSVSSKKEEKELLLAPGTKFKVLRMELDGNAEIVEGNKKSWKIFLSTIPESEEGVIKTAA